MRVITIKLCVTFFSYFYCKLLFCNLLDKIGDVLYIKMQQMIKVILFLRSEIKINIKIIYYISAFRYRTEKHTTRI